MGWALLGERSKWVPVSNDRLQNLQYAHNGNGDRNGATAGGGKHGGGGGEGASRVSVEVKGTAGESVTVSFWEHAKARVVSVECVLAASGRALAQVTSSG